MQNELSVEHSTEVSQGQRFEFGKNWNSFLQNLDDSRIAAAEQSLREMLGMSSLSGKRFLDIGSGSGLFSLAARRLGARVFSFDYDPQSVACTTELRRRFFADDPDWSVEHGSVLDPAYLAALGQFDIVYSWGVLHHTGAMWTALENAAPLVAPNGLLFIALYNDQGETSQRWLRTKQRYNSLPPRLRFLVLWPNFCWMWGPRLFRDLLAGHPGRSWNHAGRGMSAWHDVVDWLGGYPFEVAKPEQILDFYRARGFELIRLTTQGGDLGCNEFVFARFRSQ